MLLSNYEMILNRILLAFPYIRKLVSNLEIKIAPELTAPAATNGEWIMVNPELFDKYTFSEQKAIMAHEVAHVFAGHCIVPTPAGLRPQIWEIACEYMANHLAAELFNQIEIKKMPLYYDSKYADGKWLTIDIYNDLIKKHPTEEAQKGLIAGFGGKQLSGDFIYDPTIQHRNNSAEVIEQVRAHTAYMMKSMGRGSRDAIEQLDSYIMPRGQWQDEIMHWLSSISTALGTYSRGLRRRYAVRNIYLPKKVAFEMTIGVAIDTSGSMSVEELKEALGAVAYLIQQYPTSKLYFWAIDAEITVYKEVDRLEEINMKDVAKNWIRGGGGTDFRPVFRDIEDKHLELDGLLYITDLCGVFPETPPSYPVLWLTKFANESAPFGTVADYVPTMEIAV